MKNKSENQIINDARKKHGINIKSNRNIVALVRYARHIGFNEGFKDNNQNKKLCVIEFYETFIGRNNFKFVKAIKRDFGMDCEEENHGDFKTWKILNNRIKRTLSIQDIFNLDKKYGILCFEGNKIVLR